MAKHIHSVALSELLNITLKAFLFPPLVHRFRTLSRTGVQVTAGFIFGCPRFKVVTPFLQKPRVPIHHMHHPGGSHIL